MFSNFANDIVSAGICTGCGTCVALSGNINSTMKDTSLGPIPEIADTPEFPCYAEQACPGKGINYPSLYLKHFGYYPKNWLNGVFQKVRTGFSTDHDVRRAGASGGVISQTLIYLLETGRVDGIIHVKQGIPSPEKASTVISHTRNAIISGAQSVYIPVSVLNILKRLDPQKKYAMTCLPEQSAALRIMQQNGFGPALQIKYVLGPFTGTALYPTAIRCYLKSKKVRENDKITSLKWREGQWPGNLEICTESGRTIQTPKVYYNFLTPFFITQTSLQSMDFTNEFADLAVGDAWSPKYESQEGEYSVVMTRTVEMEEIINEMQENNLLKLQEEDPLKALEMHGHMIDFKKRGGYLRNQWRKSTGRMAPNYGYRPATIPCVRICVEIVITTIFTLGRTRLAHLIVAHIPEAIIGPMFNSLRLGWKKASKPTKRKGLANFDVVIKS